jgi:hypothetical protein
VAIAEMATIIRTISIRARLRRKTQSQKGQCANKKTAGIMDNPPLANSTLEN